MPKRLVPALVFLAGLAASPLVPTVEAQSSCSVPSQNRYVRDVLFEYYYWNRELPSLNPNSFPSPEAFLDAARNKTYDHTYSFIANRAEQDALFSSSQFVGLGLSTQFDGTEMRLSQVFPDSPAAEAGLRRGDRILAINGRTIAQLVEANALDTAFGPSEADVNVALEWRPAEGPDKRATLVKRVVTIPTVSGLKLFEVEKKKVGYLVFSNFVEPSVEALDNAFTALHDAGATELVLDLRYNGGGLVSVAQHLTSLIGGQRTAGKLLAEYVHNDRRRDMNRQLRFEELLPNALGLERLIVITTRASASASELVINGLRPYIPVVVVGDTTYGKPVGQDAFPFSDKGFHPVPLPLENSLGQGDYFTGLPATCPAGDMLDRQLGDPEEASLKEAFVYVRTGACTPPPPTDTPQPGLRRARTVIQPADGWAQLLGAH